MKETRHAIAVGLVTIVAVLGIWFAIRYVTGARQSGERYRVHAIFPDASGLVVHSRLRIAGIPVGEIARISLAEYEAPAGPDGKAQKRIGARVELAVDGDVALFRDAVAVRTAGSILGEQYVVLLPGSAKEPRLQDGDRILHVRDEGLLGELGAISVDIRDVTRNLRSVFGSEEGGRQMGEALANLRDISASLNELLKKNSDLVSRTVANVDGIAAENRPELRLIVADLRAISENVRDFLEKNRGHLDNTAQNADETMARLETTIAKLDHTIEAYGQVADGVNKGEGTVGRLLKDDQLIDDVEGVVDEAKSFLGSIRELKTIVGLSGEYNFYDNTLRSALQLRLQPREDKYYLIEVINDPRGSTTRTERVVESTDPTRPAQYREVVHETTDSFLFSFMFARRLHFATFRFGVKESSGGLGLDLHLLRDRVELSTDLYRFGDDVYPTFKETLAIEFLRHLYVIGGVNDVLNEGRDYFIGAMLRFDDQDLKTILAFTPSVSTGN